MKNRKNSDESQIRGLHGIDESQEHRMPGAMLTPQMGIAAACQVARWHLDL